MSENDVQSSGGSGGLLENRSEIGQDIAFLRRAIRERWEIPPETLRTVPTVLQAIIDDPRTTKRTRIMASRALGQFKADNQRDLHHIERLQHESGILDLRMRRAEEGKSNDCIAITTPPVRELPLPDAMRKMRRKLLEPSES